MSLKELLLLHVPWFCLVPPPNSSFSIPLSLMLYKHEASLQMTSIPYASLQKLISHMCFHVFDSSCITTVKRIQKKPPYTKHKMWCMLYHTVPLRAQDWNMVMCLCDFSQILPWEVWSPAHWIWWAVNQSIMLTDCTLLLISIWLWW